MADQDGFDSGMLSALAGIISGGGLKGGGPSSDGPRPTPPSPDGDLASLLARCEQEVNK